MAVIYALVDPRTDAVRYIGKTNGSLHRRVQQHMLPSVLSHYSHLHRVRWLQQLKDAGLVPEVVILERTDQWQEAEIWWIKHFRDKGADLTNSTDGGDGLLNGVNSPLQRQRARELCIARNTGATPPNKGKSMSEEQRRKIKEKQIERREDASQKHKNWWNTPAGQAQRAANSERATEQWARRRSV